MSIEPTYRIMEYRSPLYEVSHFFIEFNHDDGAGWQTLKAMDRSGRMQRRYPTLEEARDVIAYQKELRTYHSA
jgi:hypothetical protein